MTKTSNARIRELIDEAIIDCNSEEEAFVGLLTMIQDEVETPFEAKIIGEKILVVGLEAAKSSDQIMAICERNGKKYPVNIDSLEFVSPRPQGFEWIEAFLAWQATL